MDSKYRRMTINAHDGCLVGSVRKENVLRLVG